MTEWVVCLGGHDLEMIEIGRLLASWSDVEVYDHRLAWGAKASTYADEIRHALARGCTVILIELLDDLPTDLERDRIIWVDHHDGRAGRDQPTSIEQVFRLLKFPTDRWTRELSLVAANDRGHIRALTEVGATAEEIRSIRARDRQAQGITAAEEQAGREAIDRAESYFQGRLTVVKLPHARAATVTDILDIALGGPGYHNLLVFCPAETVFFGSGRCIDELRKLHPGGWCGGDLPIRGYWGIAEALPADELISQLEKPIVTKPATEVVIKRFHHILIWPLLMRGGEPDTIKPWIEKLEGAGWKEYLGVKDTHVAHDIEYEEIVYFHPFARDFLYADGKDNQEKRPSRRFKHDKVTRVKVTLGRNTTTPPELDLKVERVELYLCKPNVMLFCLEVSNKNASGDYVPLMLDVVHDFRDQFRRVHPPFWYDSDDNGPNSRSPGLCPKAVEWVGLSTRPELTLSSPKSEFVAFTREGAEPAVFAHWRCWFGEAIQPLKSLAELKGSGLYYQQIMDERMQCLSYLAATDPAEITEGDRDRLTFVDSAGTDPYPYNPEFLEQNRDRYHYSRFAGSNDPTIYYFSGYSFTALGGAGNWFYTKHIFNHFRQHYYHMGIISHYQRAALLYFTDEMSTAAKMLAGHAPKVELEHTDYRTHMEKVQMQFLKFRSRSYFPEITSQLQGQEMNRLWHTHLEIQQLFELVDQSCDQINEVLTQHAAERLGNIAAAWLPFGLGLTVLSILPASELAPKQLSTTFAVIVDALVGLAFVWGLWSCGLIQKISEKVSRSK